MKDTPNSTLIQTTKEEELIAFSKIEESPEDIKAKAKLHLEKGLSPTQALALALSREKINKNLS
ncbi:hypothetical protein K9N08_00855 [Candidatus Gracilibacteria bacterium]|nr:hypothetical protein [Candidatus Gracilibacteria bacterium]MCF7856093.1 hypothetical protein [Candidatus Gracilibacteria bacterium]MCF7896512.1 hypothetical protein [Candidatus Gracilibacteria bacterium]